jgi:hypothetical protein
MSTDTDHQQPEKRLVGASDQGSDQEGDGRADLYAEI